jgi:hypothetical protein
MVLFIQVTEDILHNILDVTQLIDRQLKFRHFRLVFFGNIKHGPFTVLDIANKSVPKLNNNVVNHGLEGHDNFIKKAIAFVAKVPDFPVFRMLFVEFELLLYFVKSLFKERLGVFACVIEHTFHSDMAFFACMLTFVSETEEGDFATFGVAGFLALGIGGL